MDAVRADPEELADLPAPDAALENEALATTALEAVDERGLQHPESENGATTPDGEPEGEPLDPEGADGRLPRLAEARSRFSG